ncbi:MAG TPA: BREX protein BrxB domain-containing protein [Chloroflexota bacterium]|nr:BREX protein BrxB domain-containing protein [Chloroflexota bacterium]
MSEVEPLAVKVQKYEAYVKLPWDRRLAGSQRVWFVHYDPAQERRLRPRLGEFEIATKKAGHGWRLVDLTDAFPNWMAHHEYREAYFERPEDMELALADFARYVAELVRGVVRSPEADDNTIVAILGVGALFPVARVSELVEAVAPNIRGRLVVFYPGHREGAIFHLLDAREGWNYQAVSI